MNVEGERWWCLCVHAFVSWDRFYFWVPDFFCCPDVIYRHESVLNTKHCCVYMQNAWNDCFQMEINKRHCCINLQKVRTAFNVWVLKGIYGAVKVTKCQRVKVGSKLKKKNHVYFKISSVSDGVPQWAVCCLVFLPLALSSLKLSLCVFHWTLTTHQTLPNLSHSGFKVRIAPKWSSLLYCARQWQSYRWTSLSSRDGSCHFCMSVVQHLQEQGGPQFTRG